MIESRIRRTVAEDVSALAQRRPDFTKEDHAATPVAESAFLADAESWLRERARQSPACTCNQLAPMSSARNGGLNVSPKEI